MRNRIKRSMGLLVIAWLVAALAVSLPLCGHSVAARNTGLTFQYCPSGDNPPPPSSITSVLATPPADFCGTPAQGNLDQFSWLSFIALNWPANTHTCGPNIHSSILTGKGPLVWETYLEDVDVFVPPGSTPSGWCPQGAAAQANLNKRLATLPPRLRKIAIQKGIKKFILSNSKAKLTVEQNFPGILQAVGGVLTDQNGRFVRYEIRMNKDEYNYIVDPTHVKTPSNPFPQVNLWSKSGQALFTSAVSFPSGKIVNGRNHEMGSIEIKAAWKVLGSGDRRSTFYRVWAIVYNDKNGSPSPGVIPVELGLVGLHIIHRTSEQEQWIWSTFEHDDNAPLQGQSHLNPHYNFYKPNCTNCPPVNTQTASLNDPIELKPNGQPINKPVQVERVNAVSGSPTQLNQIFKKLLQGSVWANYHLVSTQWLGELHQVEPSFLANMTLETYVQGSRPPSDGPYPYPDPQYNPFKTYTSGGQTFYPSSSCMKCHSVAKTTTGANANFSFMLGEAK